MVTFVLGLVLGVVVGVVLSPAIQFLVARLEWRETTRQLEMTDRLLDQLTGDADPERAGFEGSGSVRPGVVNGPHR